MKKTLRMWRPALAGLVLVAASVTLAAQQPDRKQPPPLGPAPSLKLPAIQKQRLSNGLAVWIVEHHEVPLAQINLIVRSGSAADPIGKYGVGNLTAAMLDEGAGTRSSLDLADAIEFLGAYCLVTVQADALGGQALQVVLSLNFLSEQALVEGSTLPLKLLPERLRVFA